MTFTVTPQPNNVPPRVRIDANTDDPAKPFTSLTISRDGKPIRQQPFVGGSAAVAFDYEAPFGAPATYTAVGEMSSFTTGYTTSWANLTGWTAVTGTAGVTGGKMYASGGTFTQISRAVTSLTRGRLTIVAGLVGRATVAVSTASGDLVVNVPVSSTVASVIYAGTSVSVDVGTTGIEVVFGTTGATVKTSGGSTWIPLTSATPPSGTILITVSNFASRVPAITLEDATPAAFSASATQTLTVNQTWLIHPSQPSLSCAIDSGPQGGLGKLRFVEASSGASKSSNAVATVHRPVGRKRAVTITSGPRQADEWTLVVGAPTIAQKDAVRALVDDQTPLLLRSPAGSIWDLPDDWYSVGDVGINRVESPVINTMTTISLPLTPSDEPIVSVGAVWTWGNVLTTYATWQDVLNANATWLDVLAGPS